jgi:hypothetical protein
VKKLYLGLTLMVCGALLTTGALIMTGSAIGGYHAAGVLGYQLSDYESGSTLVAFGYLVFFSGLLIAGLEAFKKEK